MKRTVILVADDDEDDRLLTKDALEEDKHQDIDLRFVEDGVELMDYLYQKGQYENDQQAPRPTLILLDLNMPKKDGREALAEIKNDPSLKRIPVVVMTTSKAEEDIMKAYELGVNSFIKKPVSFDALVEILRNVTSYWLDTVELPQ